VTGFRRRDRAHGRPDPRVPRARLLNTRNATSLLKAGVHVTVDTRSRRVYEGAVTELHKAETQRVREDERLRQDRAHSGLSPAQFRVRTGSSLEPRRPPLHGLHPGELQDLHDIARFVHERS